MGGFKQSAHALKAECRLAFDTPFKNFNVDAQGFRAVGVCLKQGSQQLKRIGHCQAASTAESASLIRSSPEVASIDANSVHMKWAEIDPTVAASVRTGCVLYDDGALSVLIPVVAIDQIDRSAEPAQSRRTQVLLDQMKAARDIQDIFAMLDRLGVLNHESVIASKKTKYRKAGPKAVKAEDPGEALSPKEFGETIVDVTLEGELQFKAATLEELRRAINRQASVHMSRLHDPDRELAEHDTNVASDEEKDASAGDHGTGTSDDEDGARKARKLVQENHRLP